MTERPSAADLARLDPDGSFGARLIEDRAELARLAGRIDPRSDAGREALAELERLAHRLAGAAGTFGYPEIGEAALALEEWGIATRAVDPARSGKAGQASPGAARAASAVEALANLLDLAIAAQGPSARP
jgi:HPt (histidine-containing phosphotransfer) domain-containing protein